MPACLTCAIDPDDGHYRSDVHRYNLHRRLAGLAPVSPAVFADKVKVVLVETHRCEPCRKTYGTANALRSHLASKKHTEHVPRPPPSERPPTTGHACLFCTATAPTLEDSLAHMSTAHSFFIPDADYLVDIAGLIDYFAQKITVEHVCIFCNGRGRERHTADAVRKHMIDKGHCKIAYDTETDKLDLSDYYDFTLSYPSDQWEDIEDDGDHPDIPDNQLTYGDTEYELVLPSGARVGHRSLMRYYNQSFYGIPPKHEDPNSGAALVRRLLADKHTALVPRTGGFGAFGQGSQLVKARNRGEAREAGRHTREFRDQRRKEDFKTKVAFIHNNQKHFRDPLLQ